MSKLVDGHLHVTEAMIPGLREIRSIANADCAAEYAWLKSLELPDMVISAGIHPWKADTTDWAQMEPILREAPVVGEIGLDSEWCTVDMDVQREVFHRQLALAMELQKPVILHTKGMEWEILETIRSYPNRYLVHWYACDRWLREYIDYGCWFTVGPDMELDADVKTLACTVPLDKLLIESDGIDGVAWALGREVAGGDYLPTLARNLERIADMRGVSAETLAKQMERNLDRFLNA